MKIAIDCRYLGKSGIGRVCQGILDHLDYNEHEYFLIGNEEKLRAYSPAYIIPNDENPFSLKGLSSFPKMINQFCDCIIIPNFIIPYGIRIPVYSVMHDLIFLDLPKITTKGFLDYRIKKMLLKRCMKKSVRIACVSGFTKSRCEHYFPKYAGKCYVNYIGLSEEVLNFDTSGIEKTNSIIYVGNVKPHKGLKTLIDAFHMLPKGMYRLKIIGEKEGFLVGMKEEDLQSDDVIFTGRLSDDQLLREIASAKFLVQPSLYEGFGLPPLEALYLGTQPIISDIPVFKEVYGDLPVIFFKTKDAKDLENVLIRAQRVSFTAISEFTQKYHYQNFAKRLISFIK
ncbi:MAG TPA: glycosyltransferase family 4 protein [Firmicutes bacterium]|nr:glycosyltransferase family 4 protein [Bacillota bacterium]